MFSQWRCSYIHTWSHFTKSDHKSPGKLPPTPFLFSFSFSSVDEARGASSVPFPFRHGTLCVQGRDVCRTLQRLDFRLDICRTPQRLDFRRDVCRTPQRLDFRRDICRTPQRLDFRRDVCRTPQRLDFRHDICRTPQRLDFRRDAVEHLSDWTSGVTLSNTSATGLQAWRLSNTSVTGLQAWPANQKETTPTYRGTETREGINARRSDETAGPSGLGCRWPHGFLQRCFHVLLSPVGSTPYLALIKVCRVRGKVAGAEGETADIYLMGS